MKQRETATMRLLLVILTILGLAGCGGSLAPGGTPAGSTSNPTLNNPTTISARGLAVSVRVKQVPNRTLQRGEEIQEALIDVLDPATLRPIIPTTRVVRDPNQAVQRVSLQVEPGSYLVRVQGRTLTGEAAGTRFEAPATVSSDQVTALQAELNPLTDLTGLQVTPGPEVALALGTTRQFTATGVRSDLTSENVTNNVVWSSSSSAVASVSSTGLVNATGVGNAVITARAGNLTASSSVNVSRTQLTSLQVTPAQLRLPPGLTRQLTATGVFSDNTNQELTNQVSWTSSAPNLATVSPTGLVSALAPGNVTVTARQGSVSATASLEIRAELTRLEVTPASAELPAGKTQQMKATGFFDDNTTQDLTNSVTWSSSSASANVSASGLVTTRTVGTANITASSGTASASALITVKPAILTSLTVTPGNATVPKGATLALRATGTFSDSSSRDLTQTATWTSTNISVAPVSNANGTRGVVTGGNVGQVVIEATQDGVSNSTLIQVSQATLVSLDLRPANPSISAGSSLQFQVFGLFSDNSLVDLTTNVTWTSSLPNIAGISNVNGTQGLASGLSAGTTVIAASTATNVTNTTTLQVTPPPGPVPAPAATPSLLLISRKDPAVTPAGDASGNGNSSPVNSRVMSSDGRYVAYVSAADDLVPGDTNSQNDVFRYDTQTNTTIRVSLDDADNQIPAGSGGSCSMSADGNRIAFYSSENNLVTDDINGFDDVFVRDVANGTITGVSLQNGGTTPTNSGASSKPAISADGNRVAFITIASNLATTIDDNTANDVYVRDLANQTTVLASIATTGSASNSSVGAPGDQPTISADGLQVAFRSGATDLLGTADPNAVLDVFVRNLQTNTTSLVSCSTTGVYQVAGAGDSSEPSLSSDGSFVAFTSSSTLIAADTNGLPDIYRRTMASFSNDLCSVNSTGLVSTIAGSSVPDISNDGRFVTFTSFASDLVTGDTNGVNDVFLRDLTGAATSLVCKTTTGVLSNADSNFGRLSPDGRFIVFESRGSNLDPLKTGTVIKDVFQVRNLLQP